MPISKKINKVRSKFRQIQNKHSLPNCQRLLTLAKVWKCSSCLVTLTRGHKVTQNFYLRKFDRSKCLWRLRLILLVQGRVLLLNHELDEAASQRIAGFSSRIAAWSEIVLARVKNDWTLKDLDKGWEMTCHLWDSKSSTINSNIRIVHNSAYYVCLSVLLMNYMHRIKTFFNFHFTLRNLFLIWYYVGSLLRFKAHSDYSDSAATSD